MDNQHFSQNKTSLLEWRAPEFEIYEKSGRWYLASAALLTGLVIYALITNSPIMAITFILIGIVGYIHLQRNPEMLTFKITPRGIVAGKDLFAFENIKSFWIFYDPTHTKTISLHTNGSMLPYVHIPLGNEDPVEVREILLEFVEEIHQEPSFIDVLERVLHV